MLLNLTRLSTTEESTLGCLKINGMFACFTIEDAWREDKIKSVTRIPVGLYDIKLRNTGGMTKKYQDRYEFHQGMLWLQDVPQFQWVYIHTGNEATHSEGCILVGDTATNNQTEKGRIGSSRVAYSRIYPDIAKAVNSEGVKIRVEDVA